LAPSPAANPLTASPLLAADMSASRFLQHAGVGATDADIAAVKVVGAPAWLGLGYVSIFSMLVGFVFWYRGLALGGIASVGQLQLLQPFFGLALAGLLLHEPVAWSMIAATMLVVVCVVFARRFA
jgi:drug/metabolite transporter (DMT)-like permease